MRAAGPAGMAGPAVFVTAGTEIPAGLRTIAM